MQNRNPTFVIQRPNEPTDLTEDYEWALDVVRATPDSVLVMPDGRRLTHRAVLYHMPEAGANYVHTWYVHCGISGTEITQNELYEAGYQPPVAHGAWEPTTELATYLQSRPGDSVVLYHRVSKWFNRGPTETPRVHPIEMPHIDACWTWDGRRWSPFSEEEIAHGEDTRRKPG